MPATSPRHRRWTSVALTTAALLAGLTAPALTAAPAAATTTAYDDTYYAAALGKTGPALKTALHGIISNQTKLSYSAVWDALKVTDQDPANSNNVKHLPQQVAERRQHRQLEPRARVGPVPRRLRHLGRARHRSAPSAGRGRPGQLQARQQGLRQRRQQLHQLRWQPDRLELL